MNEKNILTKLSIADSFTIMNGVSGLLAIFFAINNDLHFAFIFILLAVLADGADGIVARRYGGVLGRYIDEFADITSFCVAPLIFALISYEITTDLVYFTGASFFFICGLLHLVNYHLNQKEFFIGIPTPAAGVTIVSIAYLDITFNILVIAFIILGILMIVPLYYPRIKSYFGIVAVCIIGAALTGETLLIWILLLSLILYIALGPLYASKGKTSKSR